MRLVKGPFRSFDIASLFPSGTPPSVHNSPTHLPHKQIDRQKATFFQRGTPPSVYHWRSSPASSANFKAVFAFRTVIARYIVLSFDIFDQRVLEKVAIGADQKITLP